MESTATQTYRPTFSDRMHVRRSRGVVSGVLLILLGVWGGIIPFIGPLFNYAFTPDSAWRYTSGRLYLEILPAAAAVLGGLILLASANRAVTSLGAWLAVVAGAWFVVGPVFSVLWSGGTPAAGLPVATSGSLHAVVEQIGYFSGLGVVVVFFGALALGRLSVLGIADIRRSEPVHRADEEPRSDTESSRSDEAPVHRADDRGAAPDA